MSQTENWAESWYVNLLIVLYICRPTHVCVRTKTDILLTQIKVNTDLFVTEMGLYG